MKTKRGWLAAVAIVFVAALPQGCSEDQMLHPEVTTLSEDQARDVMRDLRITIPDSYSLIEMTEVKPPVTGDASYSAAFGSVAADNSPNFPHVDGAPAALSVTSCNSIAGGLQQTWKKYGFDCAMANMKYLSFTPTDRLTSRISVATGTLPTGQARLFVYSAGN
ncbi:hypothetical protein QN239_32025 [Mycolicibacterium sp. Y3]